MASHNKRRPFFKSDPDQLVQLCAELLPGEFRVLSVPAHLDHEELVKLANDIREYARRHHGRENFFRCTMEEVFLVRVTCHPDAFT